MRALSCVPPRLMLAGLIMAGLIMAGGAFGIAGAQSVSAEAIVKALQPGPGAANANLRGIRMVAPPSLDLSIEFASGSANLTPAAISQLDQLGAALTSSTLASDKFGIEGHTDTVGTDAMNLALSRQRATAVAQYLETKFAIPAARLQASGVGKAGLLVPTPDQTAEPRNRRVHITNLGS